MNRAIKVIALLAILLLSLTGTVSAHDYKVTLCHATGSATNPYVKITISHHARDAAHIDRTTGNYHGQDDGTFDYEIAEEDECRTTTPTPSESPNPSPSPSTTPTPSPSSTPTSTPTPDPTSSPTSSPATPTTTNTPTPSVTERITIPDTAMAFNQTALIGWFIIGFALGWLTHVIARRYQ